MALERGGDMIIVAIVITTHFLHPVEIKRPNKEDKSRTRKTDTALKAQIETCPEGLMVQ